MNAKFVPKSTGSGVQKKFLLKFFSTAFENEAQCPCLIRMLWYTFSSMMPSIFTKSPVPEAEMAPHTLILPPPCLTVGKRHSFLYLSPSLHRTYTLSLLSNCSNLDSSVHKTLYQSSFVHFLQISGVPL